jgi:peptide deformylase
MVLPVYLYGSSVLRQKCEPVTPDYEGLQQLIADMYETMYNADGVGLAAPQIGKSLRLIVIDAASMDEDYPDAAEFKKVLINPEILERSGEEWKYREGCLSLPEIREDVTRKSKVKIRYFDENFKEHVEEYDDIRARIIMHEYDHIEGVMFVDLLSALRRKLLKKRLENIKSGKAKAQYKVIKGL